MASNKGLKSVIICALVLGLVLEHVQVEGYCCRGADASKCYVGCTVLPLVSRSYCAEHCGCDMTAARCSSRDYPELHLLPDSGEPNTKEYCNIGCRSSVCDNLNNALRGKEVNFDMELCRNACVRFCNGDAVIQSVAA